MTRKILKGIPGWFLKENNYYLKNSFFQKPGLSKKGAITHLNYEQRQKYSGSYANKFGFFASISFILMYLYVLGKYLSGEKVRGESLFDNPDLPEGFSLLMMEEFQSGGSSIIGGHCGTKLVERGKKTYYLKKPLTKRQLVQEILISNFLASHINGYPKMYIVEAKTNAGPSVYKMASESVGTANLEAHILDAYQNKDRSKLALNNLALCGCLFILLNNQDGKAANVALNPITGECYAIDNEQIYGMPQPINWSTLSTKADAAKEFFLDINLAVNPKHDYRLDDDMPIVNPQHPLMEDRNVNEFAKHLIESQLYFDKPEVLEHIIDVLKKFSQVSEDEVKGFLESYRPLYTCLNLKDDEIEHFKKYFKTLPEAASQSLMNYSDFFEQEAYDDGCKLKM